MTLIDADPLAQVELSNANLDVSPHAVGLLGLADVFSPEEVDEVCEDEPMSRARLLGELQKGIRRFAGKLSGTTDLISAQDGDGTPRDMLVVTSGSQSGGNFKELQYSVYLTPPEQNPLAPYVQQEATLRIDPLKPGDFDTTVLFLQVMSDGHLTIVANLGGDVSSRLSTDELTVDELRERLRQDKEASTVLSSFGITL